MPEKNINKFMVYDLRETYAEVGSYEFKIVLNGRFFRNSHNSEISIVDSDRRPVFFELKKWGRKMNCRFLIDETTADGVGAVRMILRDEKGNETTGQLTFWIIK